MAATATPIKRVRSKMPAAAKARYKHMSTLQSATARKAWVTRRSSRTLPAKTVKKIREKMSPGEKAHYTAKWARTMTKWLVTYNRRTGAKWNLVDFGGKAKAEARGVVDLIAIRKNHRHAGLGLKRGDLFEIVLIQTKGGSAARPTLRDKARLSRVAKHHRAKVVILAEWQRGKKLEVSKLNGTDWQPVSADEIFG